MPDYKECEHYTHHEEPNDRSDDTIHGEKEYRGCDDQQHPHRKIKRSTLPITFGHVLI
jgi:hypothetical protein